MAVTFRRFSSLWFRALEPVVSTAQSNAATAKALRAARIGMFPEWYMALSYLASTATALVLGAAMWAALAATRALAGFPLGRPLLAVMVAAFAFLCMRLGFLAYPRLTAAGRARRIDAEMPSVVTLCYALAQGNVAPLEIIRAVASERNAYGEAAVEFGVVIRNVEWLGLDLVSALKETAATSPSARLRSFFDGLVTMLNSGADAKDYFMHQAKTELNEADMALEKDLEQASMLAEIYVSGLLVLPLLLMGVISGLAPLAAGQPALIPFIVFAFIPLGTIVYLILVETLLPPVSLEVPDLDAQRLADFGLASVPAQTRLLPPPWETSWPANVPEGEGKEAAREARRLRREIMVQRFRQRMVASWRRFTGRMLAHPTDALQFSGLVGAAVIIGGGAVAWINGLRG